jgi:hypothetical protein
MFSNVSENITVAIIKARNFGGEGCDIGLAVDWTKQINGMLFNISDHIVSEERCRRNFCYPVLWTRDYGRDFSNHLTRRVNKTRLRKQVIRKRNVERVSKR